MHCEEEFEEFSGTLVATPTDTVTVARCASASLFIEGGMNFSQKKTSLRLTLDVYCFTCHHLLRVVNDCAHRNEWTKIERIKDIRNFTRPGAGARG